jgi:hypothetical protein
MFIRNMAVSNAQRIWGVRQALHNQTGKLGDKLKAHSESLVPRNLSVIENYVLKELVIEADDTIEKGVFEIHITNDDGALEYLPGVFPQHEGEIYI